MCRTAPLLDYLLKFYVYITLQIRSKAKPMCVDSAVDSQNYHKPVNMWPCHNQGGNQYWMLSKHSEIRRDDGCLDYSGGESVIIYPCHGQKGNQEWNYREVSILSRIMTKPTMWFLKRSDTYGAVQAQRMA